MGSALRILVMLSVIIPAQSGDEAHTIAVEMIVTATPEEAAKVLNRIRAGDDFNALARQFSSDASAGAGGRLGSVDIGSLRDELRDALRTVKPGEVTGVVQIPAGYAILRIPKEAAPLADPNRDRILGALKSVRLSPDESGYGEFYESIRNSVAGEPSPRLWQMNLKNACAARAQAPRDANRGHAEAHRQ